ncbi:Autophagy protein 16 [Talaromyces islandicus]|uniref:Autophagy protein 16 n=1 Tax=Talaromyces islandicus TaxID=28573 RepID=A0A0U1LLV7_TALIS|nr:Autophagy protein 16 [Talaromyces islandicus]
MPRRRELTPQMRSRICELKSIGLSYAQVHQRYPEIPLGTIRSTIRREKDRDDNKTVPRSGRPRKISEEELERLRGLLSSGMTCKDLMKEIDADIHKRTLQRTLQALRKQNKQKGRQAPRPVSKTESKPEVISLVMANWRDEYHAALLVRDEREQANSSLYDAYSRLADRTAGLSTASKEQHHHQTSEEKASPAPQRKGTATAVESAQDKTGMASQTQLATARADLAAAQRSRAEIQDRLARTNAELDKLKAKSQQDTRKIASLEGERTHLTLRLKDRDLELRGKAKLLDNVQDELASLNLQLNMAEDRSSKLQRENKELVDRWMARMGQEADAMNEASRF